MSLYAIKRVQQSLTWLTVITRSETAIAPLRMLTAGPLIAAQLGYSQDNGSYLPDQINITVSPTRQCSNLNTESRRQLSLTLAVQLGCVPILV